MSQYDKNISKSGNCPAKRVSIVSLKMVRESSVLYPARRISSPEDAAGLLEKFIGDSDREHTVAVYLNIKNEPVAIHTVSVGTLSSSLIHPRELFKGALLANAAAVVLGHNHPSGNSEPSKEDEDVTKRLAEAGELLGIKLLDHIIIGDGRFVSLKAKGLL